MSFLSKRFVWGCLVANWEVANQRGCILIGSLWFARPFFSFFGSAMEVLKNQAEESKDTS
jgi:hypothetical protein